MQALLKIKCDSTSANCAPLLSLCASMDTQPDWYLCPQQAMLCIPQLCCFYSVSLWPLEPSPAPLAPAVSPLLAHLAAHQVVLHSSLSFILSLPSAALAGCPLLAHSGISLMEVFGVYHPCRFTVPQDLLFLLIWQSVTSSLVLWTSGAVSLAAFGLIHGCPGYTGAPTIMLSSGCMHEADCIRKG